MTRDRIWKAATAAVLLGFVAYSFYQRWQLLSATPFPVGVDGYFYPVQLRALLESGSLQYPSSPLTFWFMAPFAAATDPITGAKLGAALGGALIALPAYGVGARFGNSRGAGLVAAALASSSACSTYLTIEFVKQGIGLTVALAALWLVLRACETPSRARIAAALGGLVAALLAHKLAAGVVLAIAIPSTINEARGRAVLRGRRLLYLLAACGAIVVIVLVLGALFPQRFLSPSDAALLADLFSTDAHWSAPALAAPRLTLAFEHEPLVAAILGIAAAVALRMRKEPHRFGERAAMWIVIGLAIVIALPWLAVDHPQGLGFRLRVASFVPLALCAAILVGPLLSQIKKLDASDRDIAAAGIALLLAIRPHEHRTEGIVLAHPAMVAAVMASSQHVPAGATVIVPERHILFMVAWYARAKVGLDPARVPAAERVRLLPGAFVGLGDDSPLGLAIDRARAEPSLAPPIGLHPRHRNGLVLVTEPTWDWILAQLPPGPREHYARWPTI